MCYVIQSHYHSEKMRFDWHNTIVMSAETHSEANSMLDAGEKVNKWGAWFTYLRAFILIARQLYWVA